MSRSLLPSPSGHDRNRHSGPHIGPLGISQSFELVCCHSSFEGPSLDAHVAYQMSHHRLSSSYRIADRVRGSNPPTGIGKSRKAHEKHMRPPCRIDLGHCWTIHMG